MITKKTTQEIEILAEGGRVLARILRELVEYVHPGCTTEDLDDRAMELCEQYNAEPVLLGYHPEFAPVPYSAAICTSVNNVVQHGIPSPEETLRESDIINIDMSIGYRGLIVDSGMTVGVGKIDRTSTELIDITRTALMKGITEARAGNHIGDISYAIQQTVEASGMSVVRALCGHGVGYAVHEQPHIPNFGAKGTGPVIEVGHVYAIEPIVNVGSAEVVFDDEGDGYTVRTKDGSRSAHFEHTVAVTREGPKILTEE